MTAPLTLSATFLPNVRTRPLLDGTLSPARITLVATTMYAPEMFWRQLMFGDFDVSEMSIASLAIAISHGVTDWVALPVFTMRRFFHAEIQVRRDAGIERPADLRGKRVGVPEYQQTGAVWCRGVLADEFGVEPRELHWFMERRPETSHGGATGFSAPPGVRVDPIPTSSNIGAMLLDGSLDATVIYIPNFVPNPSMIDRSSARLDAIARPLFPDPAGEAQRYYAKTGIYPINHCVVVRRSLVEREPWIARSLFDAFESAKQHAARRRSALLEPMRETGVIGDGVAAGVERDVMTYGMDGTHAVLETITRYLDEQGLTARRLEPPEIFAKL